MTTYRYQAAANKGDVGDAVQFQQGAHGVANKHIRRFIKGGFRTDALAGDLQTVAASQLHNFIGTDRVSGHQQQYCLRQMLADGLKRFQHQSIFTGVG